MPCSSSPWFTDRTRLTVQMHKLVLASESGCADSVTGGEVMTLAKAIQTSVYERFGIRLEPEPVVV